MKDFDLSVLEHMASRFTPLSTNVSFLDIRYEWQKNANGVEWPYYRFFYHIASMLRPKLTVELGGYQGTAAAHFAAGFNRGFVVSIDHHTDAGDEENQGRMIAATMAFNNIDYFQGWTTDSLAEENKGKHALGNAGSVYKEILHYVEYQGKIDILFIDSWHTYEHAMADWEAYKPLMNSPALVICDDVEDKGIIVGMEKFWEEIPEPKFLNSNLHPENQMGFFKV